MKRTKKYLAALATGQVIGIPANGDVYGALENKGYRWVPANDQWQKLDIPANAPKTGFVDIRLRAAIGEIETATRAVVEALQDAGFAFSRVSAPDPDDRKGPATTCRVYFNGLLPTSVPPKKQLRGRAASRAKQTA